MHLVDLPLHQLQEAPWNPNRMDQEAIARLEASLERFGLVENLVVRRIQEGLYETIGGAKRLAVLRQSGAATAPCLVADLDDAQARLLAQALNRIQGEDDLGLRAELIRTVSEALSQEEVLALLPETAQSLQALASLGQEDMAAHLRAWQQAQIARLHHLQFQFTADELPVVQEALALALKEVKGEARNPNMRGRALVLICRAYLSGHGRTYTRAYRRRAS